MVHTHDLTKRFGPVVAVDGLTVAIDGPGVVGFLGPNGAGKTTVMRMLTGFLSMTSGTATVVGFDVFDAPMEVKQRVGYLPETPPLYGSLTVGEMLVFVAEIRGVDKGSRLQRVGQAMDRVGLSGHEDRLISTLSKGFRQRVGLAQAIVHDPQLLILDEPTSGLDPAQLVGIRSLIRSLAEERTVILSTHVLSEVDALCSRILLVDEGRLLADGTLEELARQVGASPWVELWLDEPDTDLSARIAKIEAVEHVQRLGPLRYRVEGTEQTEPALGALAGAHGWRIRALRRHHPTLESVFVELVQSPVVR